MSYNLLYHINKKELFYSKEEFFLPRSLILLIKSDKSYVDDDHSLILKKGCYFKLEQNGSDINYYQYDKDFNQVAHCIINDTLTNTMLHNSNLNPKGEFFVECSKMINREKSIDQLLSNS